MKALLAMPLSGSWAVLRVPIFSALWTCALISNMGTLMQEVGVVWLMTSLNSSPLIVSLIQTAETLPFVLLALPAGALADMVNRRHLVLFSQAWMCGIAGLLGVLTLLDVMTPTLLLVVTLLMGVGIALNGPVYQAIIPELVPVSQLPHAVAVNSAGFNIARAIGPGIGGVVVGLAGAGVTFLFNAVSYLGILAVVYRWQRPAPHTAGPAEGFMGAMRAGLRYVRHADQLKAVLIRTTAFSMGASVIWALLPLLVRFEFQLGATAYCVMLGCFGVGALVMATFAPMLRRRLGIEGLVAFATVAFSMALLALGLSENILLVGTAIAVAGAGWLSILSTFNTTVQMNAAEWVRGRALAIYLLVFFGSIAAGSAAWGMVAEYIGVQFTFCAASAAVLFSLAWAGGYPIAESRVLNLAPSRHWPLPQTSDSLAAAQRRVRVTIEYRIAAGDASAFIDAMDAVRRLRRRDGALRWELVQDAESPEQFIETFVVESWAEHMRQHERVTMSDRAIEEAVRAFHRGSLPPQVRHWLVMSPDPRPYLPLIGRSGLPTDFMH